MRSLRGGVHRPSGRSDIGSGRSDRGRGFYPLIMTDGVPDTNIIKVEANFDAGYDPVEANADRIAVEIGADALGTPSEKSPPILRRMRGWTQPLIMSTKQITFHSRA